MMPKRKAAVYATAAFIGYSILAAVLEHYWGIKLPTIPLEVFAVLG